MDVPCTVEYTAFPEALILSFIKRQEELAFDGQAFGVAHAVSDSRPMRLLNLA
jgi:hypothetical protein